MEKLKNLWIKYKKYFTAFNISTGLMAAIIFFVVLFVGIIPTHSTLAWMLFIIGVILAVIFLVPPISKKVIKFLEKLFK